MPSDRIIIRRCTESDFNAIAEIINDAAQAYRGIIPDDRWHEPYMSDEELRHEIDDGVVFWGYEANGLLLGVMGIQDRSEVDLMRHAYVRTRNRNQGIGTALLHHLEAMMKKPILIGTWTDAVWAIRFYRKNEYRPLSRHETEQLLHTYWTIPERQVETSIVLADRKWQTLEKTVPGTAPHND